MFSKEVHDAFRAHAISEFPKEAVGFVADRKGTPTYIPLENRAPDPVANFLFSGDDYVNVWVDGDILAVLHSHVPIDTQPAQPHPSKSDMELQIRMAVPFGIGIAGVDYCSVPFYWGDGAPIQPLEGRQFLCGVTDCFSLIRDYFRPRGISIPEVARDELWWKKGTANLYVDNLGPNGWKKIHPDEVKEHDCFLISIGSKLLNHAGIYVGNGLILHHLQDHLSMIEPLGNWTPHIGMWVRHEKDFDDA